MFPNKRLEKAGMSAQPGSVRPWFFQEQDGCSFSRANSLRPMHKSTRRYFAYATLFALSLGAITYVAPFSGQFDADDPLAFYGDAVLGACFLVIGGGALTLLALDALHARCLAAMSRNAIRRRLRNEQRSYRFRAQRVHLRGMAIGAVFFGGLCVFSIAIGILMQLGVVVPTK